MNLSERLNDDMKQAMKSQEKFKLYHNSDDSCSDQEFGN